jgi:hypothetical protein
LQEKFNLPTQVLDAKAYREAQRGGGAPAEREGRAHPVVELRQRLREELKTFAWDLVVIDEAHKLRNAYRPSNKVGQGIAGQPRTAASSCSRPRRCRTRCSNCTAYRPSSTSICSAIVNSFRSQYASAGSNLSASCVSASRGFCKRTLRNQVTEYIRYTERRPITRPFTPSDDEHALYEAVSGFLQREDSYALPSRQRHLTALILRKLLASSSPAIAATLDTLRTRSKS